MPEMSLCYNKLWKLLIDKKISQAGFRREVGIGYNTFGKLRKDEIVSLEILMRICVYLDCNVGDILDFVKIEKTEPESAEPDANKRVRKK